MATLPLTFEQQTIILNTYWIFENVRDVSKRMAGDRPQLNLQHE